jgi:hypothetical protein
MRARATGTIVTLPDKEPMGFYADEAKAIQKQRQERSRARAEARANTPIPNYLSYRELFAGFDPKTQRYADGRSRRVPKCRVCECNLYPMEHHVCEGFKPKYVEYNEEWHERMEQRREMIREARLEDMRESRNSHYCDDCGEELEFMVEHECSVRECRRCGESLYWGTEHTCEL